MPQVRCPECNHEVVCPDNYLGKMWRCPDCATRFRPQVEPPAGTPAPSPAAHAAPASAAANCPTCSRWIEWLIAAVIGALLATWWWTRSPGT